jgi:hypothetical protein
MSFTTRSAGALPQDADGFVGDCAAIFEGDADGSIFRLQISGSDPQDQWSLRQGIERGSGLRQI